MVLVFEDRYLRNPGFFKGIDCRKHTAGRELVLLKKLSVNTTALYNLGVLSNGVISAGGICKGMRI